MQGNRHINWFSLRGLVMKRPVLIASIAFVICLLGVATTYLHALSDTVKPHAVLYAKAPDGTEMCIFQEFTGTLEPYKTAFYSRRPGDRWNWFYYDHQDLPWMSGKIVLDTTNKIATIFRGAQTVARYNWASGKFAHLLRGTTNGPKEIPNMWTPPHQ